MNWPALRNAIPIKIMTDVGSTVLAAPRARTTARKYLPTSLATGSDIREYDAREVCISS